MNRQVTSPENARSSPWATVLRRRVVVCAGPGGVGKTTTAAALAVAAARRGRHVAALTVDPARRLADSLGMGDPGAAAREVPEPVWRAPGAKVGSGRLSVMMLDTKRTFDELVDKHASSAEVRDRILNNRLYQHVSAQLAGAHEYMAMEKLLSVSRDPSYDLIVLDTPPTRDALDFLSAPERLVGALDSSVMSWLGQALHPTRGLALGLLARGVSRVLGTMGRITGRELLEQLAGFIADMNDLFGGFRERASAVSRAFRGSEFGFVLVSSSRPAALAESSRLARQLSIEGMSLDAFILNRMPSSAGEASEAQLQALLEQQLPEWSPERRPALVQAVLRAAGDQNRASERARVPVAALDAELRSLHLQQPPALFGLPELPADAQGMQALHLLAAALEDEHATSIR